MPVDQRMLVNVVVVIAALCGLLLSVLALILNAVLARPLKSTVVRQRQAIEALEAAEQQRRKHHHHSHSSHQTSRLSKGPSFVSQPVLPPLLLPVETSQIASHDTSSRGTSPPVYTPNLVASPERETDERRDSLSAIPQASASDFPTFSPTPHPVNESQPALGRKSSGGSSRSRLQHCILVRSLTSPSATSSRSQPCLVPEPSSPKKSIFHKRSASSLDDASHKRKSLLSKKEKSPPPPLRTQPYTAPYYFPIPGSKEAVGYARKTRESQMALSHETPLTHISPLARHSK